MKLHEYQAKQLFLNYGLPVPQGYLCQSEEDVRQALSRLQPGPWVIKCQVHAGGRGEAGGVLFASHSDEVMSFAQHWLNQRLVTVQTDSDGLPVNHLLLEQAAVIKQELYLGALLDRSRQRIVFMASNQGGMNIEQSSAPIHSITLDPLTGPQPFQARQLAFKLGLTGKQISQFSKLFMGLAKLFLEKDLNLVEVNPLIINAEDDLICLDGKLIVDDNALFRQPELKAMRDISQENSRESHAANLNISYVSLDGNIGCMVNGAGLAMATMDIVQLYGGQPANFLDVGGSATKGRVTEAFKIITSDEKVKAILINIFGGIVRCDSIADGIINAIAEVGLSVPVVVRLEGNRADIAMKKLADSGLNIIPAQGLIEAATKIVEAVNGVDNGNSN